MGIFNDHKYKNLAHEIEKEYTNICSRQPCGECKYAFKSYCKTLFILDYMEDKNKSHTNKYKECLKKMTKEDLLNVEKLLEGDE